LVVRFSVSGCPRLSGETDSGRERKGDLFSIEEEAIDGERETGCRRQNPEPVTPVEPSPLNCLDLQYVSRLQVWMRIRSPNKFVQFRFIDESTLAFFRTI